MSRAGQQGQHRRHQQGVPRTALGVVTEGQSAGPETDETATDGGERESLPGEHRGPVAVEVGHSAQWSLRGLGLLGHQHSAGQLRLHQGGQPDNGAESGTVHDMFRVLQHQEAHYTAATERGGPVVGREFQQLRGAPLGGEAERPAALHWQRDRYSLVSIE